MVIGWIESGAHLQDADVYDDRLQCVHRGRTEYTAGIRTEGIQWHLARMVGAPLSKMGAKTKLTQLYETGTLI